MTIQRRAPDQLEIWIWQRKLSIQQDYKRAGPAVHCRDGWPLKEASLKGSEELEHSVGEKK